MVKAQQWINEKFSSMENKYEVKKLYIRLKEGTNRSDQSSYEYFNTKLEGELDLNGFKNLEDLAISGNGTDTLQPITNLEIDRCSKLQKVHIDCTNLSELNLRSNQKITSLTIAGCVNLVKMEGLEELSNLQKFDIWPDNSVPNSKLQISLSQNNWKPELGRIKEIQTLRERAKKNEQKLKELAKITLDLQKLKQGIARLRLNELAPQVLNKQTELVEQINDSKTKVVISFRRVIDLLLETQEQILTGQKEPLAQARLTGQLNAYLSILEGNLPKKDLRALVDKKTRFIKLKEQVDKLRRAAR